MTEDTMAKKASPQIAVQPVASDDKNYVTGLALVSLVAGLCWIVLLVTLDISIVATAIPRITDEFVSLKTIYFHRLRSTDIFSTRLRTSDGMRVHT